MRLITIAKVRAARHSLRGGNRRGSVFAPSLRFVHWIGWIAVSLAVCSQYGVARAAADDIEFISGLRERGLLDLAEAACARQLAKQDLSPELRVDLVLQQIQTRVARATTAADNERAAKWGAAHAAAADFFAAYPNHPRGELVALQDALSWLAEGEWLRQEWELDGRRQQLQVDADQVLRRSTDELKAVGQRIQTALARGRSDDGLNAQQLLALANHTAFQLARSYVNTARLYAESDRLNRINALARVDQQLQELNGRVPVDDALWYRIQLLRSECKRLLGQVAEAHQICQSIPVESVPAELQAKWWTETIRNSIADQTTDEWINRLDHASRHIERDPELALALVELFLAEAQRVTSESEQASWQQRAGQLVQTIQDRFGEYWVRRANLIVAKALPANAAVDSQVLIVQLATEMVRKGEFENALSTLDLAAARAVDQGNSDAAFELGYLAAAIQQDRREHADAGDRLRMLAALNPTHDQAAKIHLLSAWNLAQTIGGDAQRLAQYQTLLEDQIRRWPQAAASQQARVWLAPLLLRTGEWESALQILAAIDPQSQHLTAAVASVRSTSVAWLAHLEQNPPVDSEVVDKILGTLRTMRTGIGDGGDVHAEAAIVLLDAQVELGYGRPHLAEIAARLESVVAMNLSSDQSMPTTALIWLALLKASESEPNARPPESIEIDLVDRRMLLRAWERLCNETNRQSMATFLLDVASELDDSQPINDALSLRWQMAIADAWTATGETDRAVALYQSLIDQFPRTLMLRFRFAQMLVAANTPQYHSAALDQWRIIANARESQSEGWFEAKYQVARLLKMTGDVSGARELLEYLKAVPPGWSQSALAADFQKLLDECSQ